MKRILFLSLLLSSVVSAAPATIKVFEATAHEKPDAASATVHTFVEGTQVSVSETAENGFRRVRLPDGNTAWIAESALNLSATAADAPVQARATAEPKRPSVFVKDLKHLAELVKSDTSVAPKAQDLVQRETTSNVALYGGLIGGGAIAFGGFFLLPKNNCSTIGSQEFCTYGTEHWVAMGVGTGVMLAGAVVWAALTPKREDLLDVLNLWNQRHPEEPFEVTPVGPRGR